MLIIKKQILGGTLEDRQGERLSYNFLSDFCKSFNGRIMPINQQHNVLKKTIGYIENLALIMHPDIPNEWQLIGDLYINEGNIEDAIGGFSVSGVESIVEVENPSTLLYLPFPLYNDSELISELAAPNTTNIGKWIKKNDSPDLIAIFCTTIVFMLTPAWDHLYKKSIAPKLDNFFNNQWPKIKKRNLGLHHVQLVNYKNNEIELRFIGEKGKEHICYSPTIIQSAIHKVYIQLPELSQSNEGISRIVMYFDSTTETYMFHRIEFHNGCVEHVA